MHTVMSAVQELLSEFTCTKLADKISCLPKLAVSTSLPSSFPGQMTDSYMCEQLIGRRLGLLGCKVVAFLLA